MAGTVVRMFPAENLSEAGIDDKSTPADVNHTSGGGGGSTGDMDRRVEALEKGFEKLDGKIDKLTELVNSLGLKTADRLGAIEGRLIGIERALDSKASTADVKLVDGRVTNIPTTWQIVGLMGALVIGTLGGVAGLAFALARYLKPGLAG